MDVELDIAVVVYRNRKLPIITSSSTLASFTDGFARAIKD